MLLGALDFVQRDVPEILVDRLPEAAPARCGCGSAATSRCSTSGASTRPGACAAPCRRSSASCSRGSTRGPPAKRASASWPSRSPPPTASSRPSTPTRRCSTSTATGRCATQTQGRFGGVGMGLLDLRGRGIVVRRLIPDTPAARAGILPSDHIVRIDGESTVNMTVTDAVDRLRGEVGAPVDIYLERPGSAGPRKVTVVRDVIHPSSIERARVLSSRPGPGQPSVEDRLSAHRSLQRQHRERSAGHDRPLRAGQGAGADPGPAGQPGRPLRPGGEGGRRLHRLGRPRLHGGRRRRRSAATRWRARAAT